MFKVLHIVTYTVYFIMEGNFLVIMGFRKIENYMNFDKKKLTSVSLQFTSGSLFSKRLNLSNVFSYNIYLY